MNFKEQYKSTFSEIHASEELKKKLLEANEMEGKKLKITKNKKKITAILIAAALAVTSAVVVSAGELNDAFKNFRLFINGKEVSASDYIDNNGMKLILCDDDEVVLEVYDTFDNANVEVCLESLEDSAQITINEEIHDGTIESVASQDGDDKNTFGAMDAKLDDLKLYFDGKEVNAKDYIHDTNKVVNGMNMFEVDPYPEYVIKACIVDTKNGGISTYSKQADDNYDDSWIKAILAEL